jgi:hypothetical protein
MIFGRLTKAFWLSAVVLGCNSLAYAQNVTPSAGAAVGGFKVMAEHSRATNKGVVLEGNARIISPQIDVAAAEIAFDSDSPRRITQVRAKTNVRLKATLPARAGGVPATVDVTCNEAIVDPIAKTLLLTGNVKGFYQEQGGPRRSITGDRAQLRYVNKNISADIAGGTQPVTLVVASGGTGAFADLGTITVTAQRANLDEGSGKATLTGGARAVSTGNGQQFDVLAEAFVVESDNTGKLSTLSTIGRTTAKFDLPDNPKSAAGATARTAGDIGTPTHIEAMADQAIVRLANSSVTLQGNVSGFYDLRRPSTPATATSPGTDSSITRQNFSGADSAVLRVVDPAAANAANPAGFQFDVRGKPVTIELPAFDFSL